LPTYVYPNDPYFYSTDGIPYVGITAGPLSIPNDMKVLSSSGKLSFEPGDSLFLTYAYVGGHDTIITGAHAGVNKMLANVDVVKALYKANQIESCGFPTSVKQVQDKHKEINIYPNPMRNVLTIQSKEAVKNVQVYNLNGQEFFISAMGERTYDASLLPTGLYMVKVTTATGSKVLKVLKL
jgi:predicted nucleic acid-binding Zn finger protein